MVILRATDLIEERREQYAGTDSIDRAVARAARMLEPFVARDRGMGLYQGSKSGALRVYFSNYLSNEETRAAGLTKSPENWRTSHNMLLEDFSYFCIETLLDESIPDENLINAILESGENMFGTEDELMTFPDWPVEFDLHLDPKEKWPDIDWISRESAKVIAMAKAN